MAQHYLLYGHGGSFNHGGEAIARTTIALLREISPGCRITLSTHFADQDKRFKIEADEFVERDKEGHTNEEVYAPTWKKITPDSICIHLGGDNYCYPNWQRYATLHKKALERGAKSILWSCSIDPDKIDEEMFDILKTHHLITARENLTYRALAEHGLQNVVKVSDIAFTLRPEPTKFFLKNFVALNFGPLVVRKNRLVQLAFQRLVDYLIEKTDMNIALIPHVLALTDNDYETLSQIRVSNKKRIILVSEKLSAAQYKNIISKARFGVFSRTHAAIAAYSSLVPTLAVGYSSKSQGIASDLGMEDYVLNIEQITDENVLLYAFQKILKNEETIKEKLSDQIYDYIQNTVNEPIRKLLMGKRGS